MPVYTPVDYERLLLSGFMNNKRAFTKYSLELPEDRFSEPSHAAAFSAMLDMGETFGPTDLAERLEGHGGIALVRDLARCYTRDYKEELPSLTDDKIKHWAKKVEKNGRLRQIRQLMQTAVDQLDEVNPKKAKHYRDSEDYISNVVQNIAKLQYSRAEQAGYVPFDMCLSNYAVKVDAMLRGEKTDDRLATGMKSFDNATSGGLPEGLIVVGGLPGTGKTQLAWQWAVKVATRYRDEHIDKIVAMNSLEMTGEALAARSVLSAASVDSMTLREGGYRNDKDVKRRLTEQFNLQKNLPLFVDASDFLTSDMISGRLTGLSSLHRRKTGLVVIDFAELVSDKGENEEKRVSRIFVNAKALAKRLHIPVIMLSQFNRKAVEAPGSKVPSVHNLRYSGMAEAAADMIVLIYSPNRYEADGSFTPHPQMPPKPNVAYINVGKDKDGRTGWIPMRFIPKYTYWGDLAENVSLQDYDAGAKGYAHGKQWKREERANEN